MSPNMAAGMSPGEGDEEIGFSPEMTGMSRKSKKVMKKKKKKKGPKANNGAANNNDDNFDQTIGDFR